MRTYVSRIAREQVFERDNGKCFYCEADAEVADHVVPVIAGGEDDIDNLAASCRKCNQIAGKNDFRNIFDKKVFILSSYLCSRNYSMGLFDKKSRAKRILKKMVSGKNNRVTPDTAYAIIKALLNNN